MRRAALGWIVCLLAAAGCGSSTSNSAVCDNLAKGLTDYGTKLAPCSGGNPITIPYTKDQCTQGINNSSCTDADRQKINDFSSCLSALPTCSPATINAFTTALTTCTNKLAGITGC